MSSGSGPGARTLGRADLRDEPADWPVIDERVIGAGQFTALLEDVVRAPDGSTMRREYLKHPGAVGIIAVDDRDRVAVIKQYRHPVRHRLIEPPAGLLDKPGEDPLAAAQRELAEEVGLAAASWRPLVDLFTTPGIIGERLRLFLARDLTASPAPDGFVKEGEEIEIELAWAALDDLVEAVLAGELHNPTMVSGVLAARLVLARERGQG